MAVAKFDPQELNVKEMVSIWGRENKIKVYSAPLNQHDHGEATFKREPWWQMYEFMDTKMFAPRIIPDNIARAFCAEDKPFDAFTEGGGKDMFGTYWEFEAQVGGSMVRPGNPLFTEISEWREKVQWPDIESWDWEGSAKLNNGTFLKPENFNQLFFHTGFFERLISLMDFQNALMALFDEDTKDDMHAFFDKLTDTYINLFDHVSRYFPDINAVVLHDDWGSQKAPFFSPAVCEEMIVPYMRRLTDFLHSKNIFCELHSCGNIILQVPNMIAAGWDAWGPQLMNDCYDIYDKYGDKILIATYPQGYDSKTFDQLSEEEQRKAASDYVNRVCKAGKPSFYNAYAGPFLTDAFREEMYVQSRKIYSGDNL